MEVVTEHFVCDIIPTKFPIKISTLLLLTFKALLIFQMNISECFHFIFFHIYSF